MTKQEYKDMMNVKFYDWMCDYKIEWDKISNDEYDEIMKERSEGCDWLWLYN